MTSVIAVTHIIIWYIFYAHRLSQNALIVWAKAINNNSPIYRASISLFEMIFLTEKRLIDIAVIPRFINAKPRLTRKV